MELVCRGGIYLIESLASSGVILGFSSTSFSGLDVKEEIPFIFSELGIDYGSLAYLNQVHGNNVAKVDKQVKGDKIFTADGLITDIKGRILCVRTADCLPVIFYDPDKEVCGVIHMGWKPAKSGVADNFLGVLGEYDLKDLRNSYLILGPGLRGDCFKVGPEFLGFKPFDGFVKEKDKEYFLDIVSFAKSKFIDMGIKESNIFDTKICNLCSEKFHSYRRDKTHKRTISFILNF